MRDLADTGTAVRRGEDNLHQPAGEGGRLCWRAGRLVKGRTKREEDEGGRNQDGDVRADDYVVEFNAAEGTSTGNLQLGYMVADQWQPLVSAECISAQAYKAEFMTALPDDISATDCPSNVVVGQSANGYWARLDFEGKFALINR